MSLESYPLVSDWLSVTEDRLILRSGKVDIGQRISSALIQIAHEELSLHYAHIDVAPVQTGSVPDEGITSGSNSIEHSGRALRLAAATLRTRLVHEARRLHGGVESDWTLKDGRLHGPRTNSPLEIFGLMQGLDLSIPVDLNPPLQRVARATDTVPMRGMRELVSGAFRFVHDLDLPGMLHARVIRPPHAQARLLSLPETARERATGGGAELVQDGSFLALAGQDEWKIIKAAEGLARQCHWDLGAGLDESDVFAKLTQANAQRFAVVDGTPTDNPIPAPLDNITDSARYERPFTLHGSLAPSAALAVYRAETLYLTTHSQGIYPLRESIADSLGLSPEHVVVTHMPGAGCYGHNGADDAAFEAALVAMALPERPVLLKWTRADEHAWEPFGPAMAVELNARLDSRGHVDAYSAEAISCTHRGRPRPGPGRAGPARLLANRMREDPIEPYPAAPNRNRHGGMHRNLDPIYQFPERRLVKNLLDGLPHRTSALRCLGGAANVFALECFMDELAYAQSRDPLEFRLAHLSDPRGISLLQQLQAHLSETEPPDEGKGRGLAYAQYKNAMTRVAMSVDLRVSDAAEIEVTEAVIFADAGHVIDKAGLEAQLEGGVLQAISWALHEEVTWTRDGITSVDWDTYPVLRFPEVPCIQVHITDQPNVPSVGAGEAAPGPTLAAIGNALFDATGLRLRRLPFSPESILAEALTH